MSAAKKSIGTTKPRGAGPVRAKPDRDAVFVHLRDVMKRHAKGMTVARDTPTELSLTAPWKHPFKPDGPMWFGAVRNGKAYVSFHLMPLYFNAPLLAEIGPDLKRRMQGKTCFNFKRIEPALFKALAVLTAKAARHYAKPIALAE